ncbi:MAG: hypothetical protein GX348_02300 [Veillonellaceae bacterium]|jgi:hypothetical protein|nr:hypothetical protein [Veillonellaceae bacterium]
MKRIIILCLVMFVLSIPSVTKAENNINYRQHANLQDNYNLAEQARGQQERDKQQRERVERDKQQRERVERDRHEQRHHQRVDRRRDGHHDWSHPKYNQKHWRPVERSYRAHIPFKWHERFDRHSVQHHMILIENHEWHDRFPGLRPYRWIDRHGAGFWYHNHRVVNAIMFYNDYDELVSIGFFHNGVFILIRDDDCYYENHDTFFSLWFST